MRAFVDRVRAERVRLTQLLRDLGATPIDGQANFVLARFASAIRIADALETRGIAVRRFSPDTSLRDSLRIGCPGDERSFERLTRTLREVMT
jgi:histidinol-phosphate/aromatic aminotransferase/cobyric acid decarboxylase-like protein